MQQMQFTPDRASVSSKPLSIHGCAHSGDLDAFQTLILDNPSVVNEPNPIMCQTPLHVCAGSNKVEIVKFLLGWRGPETVEIEAKNMHGETPLHMAVKNGCNEAAQLLIDHGASVEAKANNGMTPLHISVWHSLFSGDRSVVQTLLRHNADCSAKDNEGKTPLDHISATGQAGVELSGLIAAHLREQKRRRAAEAIAAGKEKMELLEVELAKMVGLHEVKLQLRRWAKGILLDQRRAALGLCVGARKLPHMAFLGNPGTGKTMVARVLGKLLHMVGALATDRVTEVQRTDLVGEFVGHTGPKTRRKMKEAEGGILFVDEAYRLVPVQKAEEKDYGVEALEEIMAQMDDGKTVVIFAGYGGPMSRIISSNEGFCRRVTKFFHFRDFTLPELAQIARLKMGDPPEWAPLRGFRLHGSCTVRAMADLLERGTTEAQRRGMNGGLVDSLLSNARESLDFRLRLDCVDSDELVTITLADLEAGVRMLTWQGGSEWAS